MEPTLSIKPVKTSFTPMPSDASILRLYTGHYHQTGSFADSLESYPKMSSIKNPESVLTLLRENKNRKYIKLYSEFIEKWDTKQMYFSDFPQLFISEKIKEVFDQILSLNPAYVTFDLTEDCSVFFQSLVNGFNLYIELYFTTDMKDGVEAITNIYYEGNNIFAYGGSIETVFSKIITKITKTDLEMEPAISYDLSESHFAEATF
jgi:hypothetical protein